MTHLEVASKGLCFTKSSATYTLGHGPVFWSFKSLKDWLIGSLNQLESLHALKTFMSWDPLLDEKNSISHVTRTLHCSTAWGFPYILKSRFLGNQSWSLCQKNMWEIGRPSINKLHKKDTAFVLFVGGTTMSFLLLQWWVSQWRSPALLLPISISFFLWGHHEVTEFEVILQSNSNFET